MKTDAAAPGLRIRSFVGEADIPDFVRVMNAELEADGTDERLSEAGERASLLDPSESFDAARDVVLAEVDGELREYRLWGAVDPAWRRRGIGSALLADNERRARMLAATHPADRRPVFGSWAGVRRPASILLERAGYEVARWFFEMVRPDLEDLPDAPMPPGLELRPVHPDQHMAIWRANREAFRDHWGGADESEAAMRRFLQGPDADPSLWLIAWDDDEIAGGVINGIFAEQNAALGIRRGWLDSVFTRRPWRRRGLARATIARSLALLREREMTSAALGVDADNAQGALGLYESAGFAVHDRSQAVRKPMEAPT